MSVGLTIAWAGTLSVLALLIDTASEVPAVRFGSGQVCDRAGTIYSTISSSDPATDPDRTHDVEDLRGLLPTELDGVPWPSTDEVSLPTSSPASIHDAEMQVRLQQNGFRIGFTRIWPGPDRNVILSVDLFERPRDARAYHRWISTSFTCNFSNDAFRGPVSGSIGFQIRWRDGDISEQIAFVRGSARYIVSVRGSPPPPDRDTVLDLADQLASWIG